MLYAEQKFHIYAVARELFSENSRCGTVFSIPDKKDIHIMGQQHSCCICRRCLTLILLRDQLS